MSEKAYCSFCQQTVRVTKSRKFFVHGWGFNKPWFKTSDQCSNSGQPVDRDHDEQSP